MPWIIMKLAIISFLIMAPNISNAASLEDRVNATRTTEQKYKEATQDITDHVFLKYKNNLEIDSPVLEVVSSSVKLVDVKMTYKWSMPDSILDEIRDTLGKYFLTTLYESQVIVSTSNCNGPISNDYCDIREQLGRFMASKSVGTQISFLGGSSILSYDSWGVRFAQRGEYETTMTIEKSKIHGDPKPTVKTHVYNISGCKPSIPECIIKGIYRQ